MPWRTRVFELAAKRGWNQSVLARRMGVSQATISRIKSGETGFSAVFMRGAMELFPNETAGTLFWFEEEPAPVCAHCGAAGEPAS